MAHKTGASGLLRKTSAPPSPVGKRSSFTSEEDSVGRGFPSILSLAAVVLFQSNLFQNSLEARLVANAVVDLVNLKIPTGAVLLLISFFQPIQSFLLVSKSQI